METTSGTLPEAARRIVEAFRDRGGAVVALSGGVDSSVVAALSNMALGPRALAVTADSETLPPGETEEAERVASEIGVRHRVVEFSELEEPGFADNPEDRCYHCRRGLIRNLRRIAEEEGIGTVADGTNADDLGGHRPGFEAVKEEGVFSPLVEYGVTKDEVRRIARALGLSVAEKPSLACLSSRIPYGEEITEEKLEKIARAEEFLNREYGFEQLRVRMHGDDLARIEVSPAERGVVAENVDEIAVKLKHAGFLYVTMDLQGYREGAMDEVLAD
ncbi:MAG: NH(3)-dependent NAD(+) synthetase [Methanonatronarchaeales archaeon]|nr:NH(3)-dependent NAD(+) synthetase [Methanonatronarchaeales archaeon]